MALSFVDTNVLVYAFDRGAGAKHERAIELIEREEGELVVSAQVLQEFYVVTTRKLKEPLPESDAARVVQELATLQCVALDAPLVVDAVAVAQRLQLSLWDALIVQAAARAGCTRLYSEDLQAGLRIGELVVVNPFV